MSMFHMAKQAKGQQALGFGDKGCSGLGFRGVGVRG